MPFLVLSPISRPVDEIDEALDGNIINSLQAFSQKSVLHWLEAAGLLGTRLYPPPDAMSLLNDVELVVLVFFKPISQSALPRLPDCSAVNASNDPDSTFKFMIDPRDEWDNRRSSVPPNTSVYSLVFSPDGYTIASASDDHGIQLWNLTAGINIANSISSRKPSCAVCFSPSGTNIAAAFEGGPVL
ncbi:hypothetical protein BV22DRAFT_1133146 [Leucogyrophana mollusca]|uniref:Uncharacterized protein n=1 Tax=Leucogyrophana mollusca TaxID=85980 RepID=A0ACB8B472_9AGAM|nr:hypothetical protein BV22DRAFT_1133146 [Leucogyrophana mollusca]